MTIEETMTAIRTGARVEGGTGADRDTGRVVRMLDVKIGECDVEVAWDSGVRTLACAADLHLV